MKSLIIKAKNCILCQSCIPNAPRPIFQVNQAAKILIIGQAPGQITHNANKPFADASGKRLRSWLGIPDEKFYSSQIAIMPMAFCYPGKLKSGDAPPPKQCSETWHHLFLDKMPNIKLTLLIGKYAITKYLPNYKNESITKLLQSWENFLPLIPLLHSSPRNNIWLHKNKWFEKDIIPQIQILIKNVLMIDNFNV